MDSFSTFTKFVRNTYQIPNEFIPLHPPIFRGNEKKYLNECIDSTFVSSVGKFVSQFEDMIAQFTGAKYAIAASSGTAALHMALILADVNANDEVITQPLTFIATANAISYCNAHPVFIDVDKDTLGLSPEALEVFLSQNTELKYNPKTGKEQSFNTKTQRFIGACIPMHTFGHPARIKGLVNICNKYHITLIEDAAESLGSYYDGQHTGTFGLIGTLSFNGNKTITTGGGGMILTNDEVLAKKAKHLTTTAKVPHSWEYIHDFVGYNYRLTNLAAALGVAQMEQIDSILESKRQLALNYEQFFKNSDITFISENEKTNSNYWLNAIILNNRKKRDDFLEFTNSNGVMTRPIWELMNRLPMFKDCQHGNLDNAEWLVDRVVNIPSGVISDL